MGGGWPCQGRGHLRRYQCNQRSHDVQLGQKGGGGCFYTENWPTGLQADGLRSEAKDADDETELLQSVAASRLALAAVESGDSPGWISTAFHLAYAFHALGEARRDVAALDEAIGLYEQVAGRLADPEGMEEDLHLAQVRMNLSEAMAQKGEIIGDAALARDALNIAIDAHMTFTLWGHDDGFEVAQANCERISAIIDVIESR